MDKQNKKTSYKACFNTKNYNEAETEEMKENIKKYIDENAYLFRTDTVHTVQFHLKPRIVAQSVENSCLRCRRKICTLSKCKDYKCSDKKILKSNFTKGMHFAIKYINVKDKN